MTLIFCKRRFLTTASLLFTAIIMIVAVFASHAAYAGELPTAEQVYDGCVWSIDEEGTLTIKPNDSALSNKGKLEYAIGSVESMPWTDYAEDIKSVVIRDGVKTGSNASEIFRGLSNATSMDLSGLDTSEAVNMHYMFYGFESLEELDVSNFDFSNVEDMSCTFMGCRNLIKIIFPENMDTPKLERIGSMFSGCEKLESIDLSGFNTSNSRGIGEVADMYGGMFAYCASLKKIDISNFDTTNFYNWDHAFMGCTSLETIVFPENIDTSKSVNMKGVFQACKSLRSLDLSRWDLKNIENMAYIFSGCSNLEFINLSGISTPKLQKMKGIFLNCTSLKELDLSGFDLTNVNDTYDYLDYGSTFVGCDSLEKISIGTKFRFIDPESASTLFPSGLWRSISTDESYTPLQIATERAGIADTYCLIIDISATKPTIDQGKNQVWEKGSSTGLTIRSTAPLDEFIMVRVNGNEIASSNYTLSGEAVTVTLQPVYLQALYTGFYTIEVISEGGTASTQFCITDPNEVISGPGSTQESSGSQIEDGTQEDDSPQAGGDTQEDSISQAEGSTTEAQATNNDAANMTATISGNWVKTSGKWWYKHDDGTYSVNKWEQINGKWYHFDKTGYIHTGWQKIGSKWYFLHPNNGDMQTGWKASSGSWYYLDKKTGAMKTGWLQSGKTWYYLGNASDGSMKSGWQQIGKKWYYFASSGAMAANKWVGNYYLQSNGSMATSKWVDGGKYYVNSSGAWIPGKKK